MNEIRETYSVKLIVYDLFGREVVTLVNEIQKTGDYEVKFNATDLKTGVYFYRLKADVYVGTKKMLLVK